MTDTRHMETATETHPVSVLHLCTKNDVNGNPRRLYVGLNSNGHVVRVTDEGYEGRPSWVRALSDRGVWDVRIEITPKAYREWKKR